MPRFNQGYKHSRKLTLAEVRAIQREYGQRIRDLAAKYDITPHCVREVRSGRYEVKHGLYQVERGGQ